MKILALQLEKSSGCAIMVDGKIVFSSSEERFTRIKSDSSFPKQSIHFGLKIAGIKSQELDKVLICSKEVTLYASLVNLYSSLSVNDQLKMMKEYWEPRLVQGKTVSFLYMLLLVSRYYHPSAALVLCGAKENHQNNSPTHSWFPSQSQTHRDYAQSCLFLTGHFKDGKINFDWPKLITEKQTLVIYMGLLSLSDFIKELVEHGQNKTMPVAVIQSGTTNAQRVIVGNIGNIKSKVVRSKIKSPALVIIGEVVNLRDQLKWFK